MSQDLSLLLDLVIKPVEGHPLTKSDAYLGSVLRSKVLRWRRNGLGEHKSIIDFLFAQLMPRTYSACENGIDSLAEACNEEELEQFDHLMLWALKVMDAIPSSWDLEWDTVRTSVMAHMAIVRSERVL